MVKQEDYSLSKSKGFAHLLLIIVPVLIVIAGGFYLKSTGKFSSILQPSPSPSVVVDTGSQQDKESGAEFTSSELGIKFQLPESFQKVGTLKEFTHKSKVSNDNNEEADATSICISYAGIDCLGGSGGYKLGFYIAASTEAFYALEGANDGRGGSNVDFNRYKKIGDQVYDDSGRLVDATFTEHTNKNGLTYIKFVKSDSTSEDGPTIGNQYVYKHLAVFNLPQNEKYKGFSIQADKDEVSDYDFDLILSSMSLIK